MKSRHFWALLAMVLFGVGEILGAFFISFFIERIGSKLSSIVNILILTLMGVTTYAYISGGKFNATAYLMCFFWGF
jgi:predicted MFS family arabinose efflux permease